MFSKFSEDAQKVLLGAKREMQNLKHPYVGSEHLILSILKNNKDLKKKLGEFQITYDNFYQQVVEQLGVGKEENDWFLFTPFLKRAIETAILLAKEMNNGEVTTDQLFLAVLEEGEGVAVRILNQMNVDMMELQEYFSGRVVVRKKKGGKKLIVEEFGVDLTKEAAFNRLDPVIGREEELTRVMEILCRRTKNNPLLIGDAGVGKTAIVEELARRIVKKQVPNQLLGKRILSVSIASLVAGTKYRGEFEERITKMIAEIEKDHSILLFIDEIHTLMGAGGAEGAIDAANIFKPALARGKIRLIGATTTTEYKQSIEKDTAIDRRFQCVFVEEPTNETVYEILKKLRPMYEDYHHVQVSDAILKSIISLTNRYVNFRKQPDKSLDILDEVCSKVSLSKNKKGQLLEDYHQQLGELLKQKNYYIIHQKFNEASKLKTKEKELVSKINDIEVKMNASSRLRTVKLEDVSKVISRKTKIPVYEIEHTQTQFFERLEKKLKREIQGQNQAIDQLIKITKRIQLGFHDQDIPPSFLFVGPTGVGKTLLAKRYSELLFGKSHFIRFDMSEYADSSSITKIIGSNPGYVGYDDCHNRLEEIRSNPHAVILFDEIEKAHPSVLNLFLQILEDGKLTDARGNVVSFAHHIIIMTSNLGFQKQELGFSKSSQTVRRGVQDFLSTELVNRIDQVIEFSYMDSMVIQKIVKNQLKNVRNRFKEKGIQLQLSNKMVSQIIDICEYQEFGARRIRKIIEDKVDSYVIEKILLGQNHIHLENL